MNKFSFLMFLAFVITGFLFSSVFAQETIVEKSTDKVFPREISFTYDTTDFQLQATGTAVRKKFVFKVYGMVHYMQNAPTGTKEEIFSTILTDNYAKQLTLDFARDVGADKIKDAFQSGFAKNAAEAELQEIQPTIDEFLKYFDSKVKKNEQYIFRWLPGGIVASIIKGVEYPEITNATFARLLWTIWLGEDSIVDRDDLISFLVEKN